MTPTNNFKPSRPVRYFAVKYFDGDETLSDGRQSVFRSKRLSRAKRIARANMPPDADRMELVEINGADFNERREAHRHRSGQ
ncbi:hypothetical protein [Ensifer adhaerens]|uniref:hypothetical protein n=1 Tax=Ensifer adhaerens TaxID=106592 RepID=UPI001C4E1311|nr:hypothetical protein [Ensifer adhaerens]MBW0369541.1 hypothetical protein [Ensifer adhaerens]UCM21346.1 hypothetical protein LDL63_07160 [Ensifer adhaerens]